MPRTTILRSETNLDLWSRLRRLQLRALLAAGLAAAALWAAAGPGHAATGRADAAFDPSANPACPMPDEVARQTAQRFTDIEAGHTHAANIGCLVHFGITVGAGDGSYFDPGRGVDRWQMALFMTRAAELAGVTLPGGDQGFTDVGDLRSAIRAGVNAAAALGIMPGTSSTEFSPRSPVRRADMALYLVRLLELVTDANSPIDVTVDPSTGAVTMTRRGGGEIIADDSFDDVAAMATAAEEHAINAIYELGVTTGTSKGLYDPAGRVTRGQMAAFIVRLLGHSSLRPDGPVVLAPWEPGAPGPLPADPGGVYLGDPLQLIVHTSFERAYSLPGPDGDVLEVWLCNTPEKGRRYSTHPDNRHNPTNYAAKFASQVTEWFEWLSNGLYTPVFVPGGVVDVESSSDYFRTCDDAVLAEGLDRWTGIDGAVIVVGADVGSDRVVGRASCGFYSQRAFPDNHRTVLVNGDAFTYPMLLAHEMGHALCWPHSYSGETHGHSNEIWEYDNPMDIMGSPVLGESDPVPLIGTPAINRYAAGWIPTDQVRVHKLGTTARYKLVPPGEDGIQLLVIPVEEGSRVTYWALGARVAGSGGNWWADAAVPKEGVEMYIVDQSVYGCDLPDRGYCYGLARRTTPLFDHDDSYDESAVAHVMSQQGRWWWRGSAGSPTSVRVELVEIEGSTFTVEVRPNVEEAEPEHTGDWTIETGARTAGDYISARTFTDIGSSGTPDWLQLYIRCMTHDDDLEVAFLSSQSHFAGTPTVEYRFGSQPSSTSLSMTVSTDSGAGFLRDGDIAAFIRQLRADTSGVLYVDLWDRPAYGGRYVHEAGGTLGVAGVAEQVEPVLRDCGY